MQSEYLDEDQPVLFALRQYAQRPVTLRTVGGRELAFVDVSWPSWM